MLVRRIRTDEVEAYREMRLRALREAPFAYGSTLEGALLRPHQEWAEQVERFAASEDLVLFVLDRGDGRLAGSAAAIEDGEFLEPSVIQMWLDEDLRGLGWAEALIGAAEGYLRRRGHGECGLWVTGGNPRARRFYERMGYAATGLTVTNSRGDVEHRMSRSLVA